MNNGDNPFLPEEILERPKNIGSDEADYFSEAESNREEHESSSTAESLAEARRTRADTTSQLEDSLRNQYFPKIDARFDDDKKLKKLSVWIQKKMEQESMGPEHLASFMNNLRQQVTKKKTMGRNLLDKLSMAIRFGDLR